MVVVVVVVRGREIFVTIMTHKRYTRRTPEPWDLVVIVDFNIVSSNVEVDVSTFPH